MVRGAVVVAATLGILGCGEMRAHQATNEGDAVTGAHDAAAEMDGSGRPPPDFVPHVLAALEAKPFAIAVDESGVYVTSSGAVRRLDPGGGATRTIATDQADAYYVAVDATDVYWTNNANNGYGEGAVMKAAKAGGPPVKLADALLPAPDGGVTLPALRRMAVE